MRYETPYSDLHAVDLLTTVDDLVQQRRLVPGQLSPLLALMGVGAVVTGADDDISRSGAIDPAAAAGVLTRAAGAHAVEPLRPGSQPAAGGAATWGASVALPQVRRYDVGSGRGIVHVDPSTSPTIVDGGAQGLADLGAFGGLPSRSPLFYAGDLTPGALRAQAAGGANVVITDSNRRREFLPQSTQQNLGPTLTAAEPLPTNAAVVNPFAPAGTNAQTVTVLQGARYLNAPTQAGELQFPEHAPIAAFDGDLSTSWVADRLPAVVRPLDRDRFQCAARRSLRRRLPPQRRPRNRHRGRRQRHPARGRSRPDPDRGQPAPRLGGSRHDRPCPASPRWDWAVPAGSGRSGFPASPFMSSCAPR